MSSFSFFKENVKKGFEGETYLPCGSVPPEVSKLVNEPGVDFIQCKLLFGSV